MMVAILTSVWNGVVPDFGNETGHAHSKLNSLKNAVSRFEIQGFVQKLQAFLSPSYEPRRATVAGKD